MTSLIQPHNIYLLSRDWLITSEYNEKVGVDSQYVLQSLTDLGNRWDDCADDPEQELQGKRVKKKI